VRFKDDFAARTQYRGYQGVVNIAAVQGGRPWKASRSPDSVSIYVDMRFPPGWTPLRVKAEVDKVIWELREEHPNLQLTQQPFSTNPPTEISEDDYVVGAIRNAHATVFKRDPEVVYQLWYSNAPHLNAMGARAINYGSAGSRRISGLTLSDRDREYVHVGDLVDCAKVYALTAVDVCSKTRAEVRPDLL